MIEPSHAVFLSYASQDAEAAQRICEALRSGGIEVWFDKSELRGGDAWDRSIRQQIHDCALFIPIVSQHTQERLEGYFRREWRLAVERAGDMAHNKAFLVPIVIDAIAERDASVPDKFLELQWTRLPRGETPPGFVDRVRHLLAGEPSTMIRASGPARKQAPSWSKRAVVVGAAVVMAGVVGYFAVERAWISKPAAPAAVAPQPLGEKSIAVLPFVDMSEGHDQQYLADGMAEEILDQLARVPGLKVIGRTSAFQFNGKPVDLRKIGTTLGAAYVLEGSVRKSGDQVRITAQLINTHNATHEWSNTYDRHLGDVLRLQDAIAAAVVRELQLTVEPNSVRARSTVKDTEAYDLYLRGRHAADRFDREGLDEAISLFKQMLSQDPNSSDALAELAYAYYAEGIQKFLQPRVAFEEARQAAETALRGDPTNARAHFVLGKVYVVYDWDWAGAEREFKRLALQAPGSAYAHSGPALLYMALGRWDDALREVSASLTVDPLDPDVYQTLMEIQLGRDRLAESEAAIRRTLEIRPTYAWGHALVGLVMLFRGDAPGALVEIHQEPDPQAQQEMLAMAFFALGRKTESDVALTRMLKKYANDSAYSIGVIYAFRGQREEAIKWLERAYAQKDAFLQFAKAEISQTVLASDPRYKAFLRKMNLPE